MNRKTIHFFLFLLVVLSFAFAVSAAEITVHITSATPGPYYVGQEITLNVLLGPDGNQLKSATAVLTSRSGRGALGNFIFKSLNDPNELTGSGNIFTPLSVNQPQGGMDWYMSGVAPTGTTVTLAAGTKDRLGQLVIIPGAAGAVKVALDVTSSSFYYSGTGKYDIISVTSDTITIIDNVCGDALCTGTETVDTCCRDCVGYGLQCVGSQNPDKKCFFSQTDSTDPGMCLNDGDNDGLPQDYENDYPGLLNDGNAADAALDSDNDGLTNLEEYLAGTAPNNADTDGDGVSDEVDLFPLDPTESLDTDSDGIGDNADTDDDGDGIPDTIDNCPLVSSADQTNSDTDGLGNVCDDDDDNDGVLDAADNCPLIPNTNQLDRDGDLIGDLCDPDDDNDGLSDDDEATYGTDQYVADTDGDGINDGEETIEGIDTYITNPLLADTDSDTYSDSAEINGGSDPTDPASVPFSDSDGDGINDPDEYSACVRNVGTVGPYPAGAVFFTFFTSGTYAGCQRGDVNVNGAITSDDIAQFVWYYNRRDTYQGGTIYPPTNLQDSDGDTNFNSDDLAKFVYHYNRR